MTSCGVGGWTLPGAVRKQVGGLPGEMMCDDRCQTDRQVSSEPSNGSASVERGIMGGDGIMEATCSAAFRRFVHDKIAADDNSRLSDAQGIIAAYFHIDSRLIEFAQS